MNFKFDKRRAQRKIYAGSVVDNVQIWNDENDKILSEQVDSEQATRFQSAHKASRINELQVFLDSHESDTSVDMSHSQCAEHLLSMVLKMALKAVPTEQINAEHRQLC